MELKKIIDRLYYNSTGQMFISAIFGLAIALLFKRVCKDNCILYYAPRYEDVEGKTFKIEDTCYKYKSKQVECNKDPIMYYAGSDIPENKVEEPSFLSKVFA